MTARKAAAIEDAKNLIEELAKRILELKGRLGTYVAEIAKLEKDIADTTEAINKAEEVRAKEHEEYIKKKADLEHALANLIKAIDVLTAGTTFEKSEGQLAKEASMEKAGISAAEETQVLSVAAGLRAALASYDTVTYKSVDVAPIKSFLSNPSGALVQLHANPALGTYNAQSGVIQGILSQMKEDFEKELTDAEKFFDETKEACSAKAKQWSGRSRSRTEELEAIDEAIGILTSEEAKATFANSTSTFFLQISEEKKPAETQTAAMNILKQAARVSKSLGLATLATKLSTTAKGHFDTILHDIDVMIENLRAEEKADIEHRDWCESEKKSAEFKNENLIYDQQQLEQKIQTLALMAEAKATRIEENTAFKQALKDDAEAVKLIDQALLVLSKVYGFVQKPRA